MTLRQVAKNATFGILYGRSGDALRRQIFPVPAPSVVERLAALTDPVIAQRVWDYDHPEAAMKRRSREILKRWRNIFRQKVDHPWSPW